jgi:hypothetical protein
MEPSGADRALPNIRFQQTSLHPLRSGRDAAEPERYTFNQ